MKNNIEELLNKYFEGETTCEEERQLRRFFAKGFVPEHLEVYRPMFAFFGKKRKPLRYYLTYSLGTVAATFLLAIGVSGVYRHLSPAVSSYVIIDGQQYTDAVLVREQAKAAFHDVSFSEEDVFVTLFE
ncbi:hypothetical protein [uncultured Bacteroides sp.]|uniref:hypothetical protein n=1 Tax=uncultured Bacteroides sp. TaxID=162156 RepID=UPI0025E93A61|nr:hypothetical protein [uncultured Bacteroides sp.]